MTKNENLNGSQEDGGITRKKAPMCLKIATAAALVMAGAGLIACNNEKPDEGDDLQSTAPIEQPDNTLNPTPAENENQNNQGGETITEANFVEVARSAAESKGWEYVVATGGDVGGVYTSVVCTPHGGSPDTTLGIEYNRSNGSVGWNIYDDGKEKNAGIGINTIPSADQYK